MMPPIREHLLAVAIACLVALAGVQTYRVITLGDALTAAQLAPEKAATLAAAARVETVTVRLAAAERVVTRTINSIRIDTLMIHPQTAQDTATALVQLPALAVAHDSLQRTCSAFVVSCADYRLAAERRFAADSVYRVSLEALRGPRCGWRCGAVLGVGTSILLPHARDLFSAIMPFLHH